MSINIDPESLKALAEDVDLKFAKTIKDLTAENAALKKQIVELKNTPQEKVMDIVSYGSISTAGGYDPVSVTLSHSLGATPSKTRVSMSIHDSGYYSAYVYVSSVSSTTVTVTVPAGYAVGNVFVLLMK